MTFLQAVLVGSCRAFEIQAQSMSRYLTGKHLYSTFSALSDKCTFYQGLKTPKYELFIHLFGQRSFGRNLPTTRRSYAQYFNSNRDHALVNVVKKNIKTSIRELHDEQFDIRDHNILTLGSVGMKNKNQKWNPCTYHSNSSVQLEAAKSLISQSTFAGNEKILDIGCGDGKITAILLKLVPRGSIFGIDLSQDMVEFAKEKFEILGLTNIFFAKQDARSISYENEFDVLFSSYALHWITNFDDFMLRANRALKPGGKVLFTIPLGISDPLEQASKETMGKGRWAKYFECYEQPWQFSSKSKYFDMVSQANFELEKCDTSNHRKIFDSVKDYRDYIVQWYPYLHLVDESEQADFFDQVIKRALELETVYSDGKVNFEFPQIDIIGHKK